MKKAIFSMMLAVFLFAGVSQTQAEGLSKSEVKEKVKQIAADIKSIAKAVKAKDRAEVGKLSGSLRKQWYGLPWGVRQAIESSNPGSGKYMKTVLDGTSAYAGGENLPKGVRVLLHKGWTKYDKDSKTTKAHHEISTEDGELVRERDRETKHKGKGNRDTKIEVKDGDGNIIRKEKHKVRKNGNTTTKDSEITRKGFGTKSRVKLIKTEDGKTKRVKRYERVGGELWAHVTEETKTNGQYKTTTKTYENSNGRKLFFIQKWVKNGQYLNSEGAWYNEDREMVAYLKTSQVKINGQIVGDKEIMDKTGALVYTRNYKHVKDGDKVYHTDERTNVKKGKTRVYEGTTTKTGKGEREHEGTVTKTRN